MTSNSELTPLSAVRPEVQAAPKEPTKVVVLRMCLHSLLQLATLAMIGAAWLWLDKLETSTALGLIAVVTGWSAGLAVRGKPPTALVAAVWEAGRIVGQKYLS